jgi:hypothetical protein
MAVFAIALDEANPEVEERIQNVYPDHYKMNDIVFLVEGDTIPETIAVAIGIKGENQIDGAGGVVLRLYEFSYSGYSRRGLWDWFNKVEESHGR